MIARSLAFAALLLSTAAYAQERADLVLMNGRIFTADAKNSVAEALAVKDGKFLAVGSSQSIGKYIGAATKRIDLGGRFVTPGLADGHLHNEGGGPGIDLSQTRTLAELLGKVGEAAKGAKPGEVIVSNNDWHEAQLKEKRLPLATEIDRVAPDNPVVLVRGGHEFILNSAALAKWSITAATPVPDGGEISKGPDGKPNGELFDNARQLVQLGPRPPVSVEDILRTQRKLNAYGITAVRIPGSYRSNLLDDYRLMKQVKESGRLTLRLVVYLPGMGIRDSQRIHDMIVNSGLTQDEGDDWLKVGGVKLLVDGGFEGGHMEMPYQEPFGKNGTFSGLTVVPRSNFIEVVKEVNRLGWRISTHAVGDAAVAQVLEAYEQANEEHPIAGKRWTIEHGFVVHPQQIAEMKKLGLILSVQDHLYLAGPAMKRYWGSARASEVTPVKDYLKSGLLLVGGTDSPVIPFNPFWEIYHFNTRDTISDGVYGADQKVESRATLLRMVTINYAKMIGEDAKKGSIEPGKLADFAVLTDDVLKVPAKRLLRTKALATYIGGKEVYRDPSWK